MAFRKRNVAIGGPTTEATGTASAANITSGVRPSSLTSHRVTSTGATSLDAVLGGHGGLALGCSVLLAECGTTDFAGALLRYFAAQGICHGHVLHVVGVGEAWIRNLPGVADEKGGQKRESSTTEEEKMKIAWRYERLGQAGERALPDRSASSPASSAQAEVPFCHTFDMSKRLLIPQDAKINHLSISSAANPFDQILQRLRQSMKASPASNIHRLVMPTVLSPALYIPEASKPETFIRFLHSLRSLLRQYPNQLTAMMTLPLELYPRSSGLVRWAEILSDGVIELTPFPHLMDTSNAVAESGGARANDEQPQGLIKVHKIPINTERGEGGAGAGNSIGEDLAFTVSRRKFVIKPFSLPPLEGDQDAQKEGAKLTGKEIEF